MKIPFVFFVLMVSMPHVFAQNIAYLDKPAILTGKVMMLKSLIDEPPFNTRHYPAVALDQTLTVEGYDRLNGEHRSIRTKLIQLADAHSGIQYSQSNGKRIRVQCSKLYSSHTSWHNTKVLCLADDAQIIR